jgi:uncharacterized protein (TIGR00645 family)
MTDSPAPRKTRAELRFELWLFRARWLKAPFYVGLVVALAALLVVFVAKAWDGVCHVLSMTPEQAILLTLSLIDLSLAANLLLIVIFSGYENFVSHLDTGGGDRPDWMGQVNFSGLKLKLIASIVAISAVALLGDFMQLVEGDPINDRALAWLVGLQLTFVVSGVLMAIMDRVSGHTADKDSSGH